MERATGKFGIADFVVAKNRRQATFLGGVAAMIAWSRIGNGTMTIIEVSAGGKK